MTVHSDLVGLASVLADWAAGAPGAKLYLFGSRVRGDQKPDSDVDLSIEWLTIADADMQWWTDNNQELFGGIDAKLPGKLHILEEAEPVTAKIRAAPVVYRDRNVFCVHAEPKPT